MLELSRRFVQTKDGYELETTEGKAAAAAKATQQTRGGGSMLRPKLQGKPELKTFLKVGAHVARAEELLSLHHRVDPERAADHGRRRDEHHRHLWASEKRKRRKSPHGERSHIVYFVIIRSIFLYYRSSFSQVKCFRSREGEKTRRLYLFYPREIERLCVESNVGTSRSAASWTSRGERTRLTANANSFFQILGSTSRLSSTPSTS